jgi:hypothetical protein
MLSVRRALQTLKSVLGGFALNGSPRLTSATIIRKRANMLFAIGMYRTESS